MLLGVLAQAVAATLIYLAPMLLGRSTTSREVIRLRLERGATRRTVVLNLGVLLVVVGTAGVLPTLPLVGLGLSLAAAAPVAGAMRLLPLLPRAMPSAAEPSHRRQETG